jgi:hypothetical protein
MRVLPSQAFIGEKSFGVECGTSLNVLPYFRLKSGLLAVCHNHRLDLAAALKDAHNGSLILGPGSGDATSFDAKVHVAGLAANERLISFDLTGELGDGVIMHGSADAMHHEPRRLLCNADGAGYFAGANAVLAIAESPVSAHPLIKPDGGIFENGSHLETELFLAYRAKPNLASFDEGMLLRTAARAASHTFREPQIECVLESTVCVREVDDCLLECVRGFHKSNHRLNCLVCHVCNCPGWVESYIREKA